MPANTGKKPVAKKATASKKGVKKPVKAANATKKNSATAVAKKKKLPYEIWGNKIFRLKVTLGTRENVWREILVPARFTLGDLHYILQTTFGWLDCHLNYFASATDRYTADGSTELFPEDKDQSVKLYAVLQKVKDRLLYEYDFGDSWEHYIELTEVLPRRPKGIQLPLCVDGNHRGPPEDCGSYEGFTRFLKIMRTPSHKEHKGMKEWYTGRYGLDSYDPVFNKDEVNQALATLDLPIKWERYMAICPWLAKHRQAK